MRVPYFADAFYQWISVAINGRLGFGNGASPDNLIGEWIEYTSNATPDTEDAVTHSLGSVPVGMIVMLPPKSGFVYLGASAWTSTQIFLKCSAASQTVRIFLIPESQGS